MLIRSEFEIQFQLPSPLVMVSMLSLHPSLAPFMRAPEQLKVEHSDPFSTQELQTETFLDGFGNRCFRFAAPAGTLRLTGQALVEVDGYPDTICTEARQHPVDELPKEVLQYLLASRYCEVDRLTMIAGDLFGNTTPGWARAIFIRDWVHNHVRFDYNSARPSKTAVDVFTERVGVCRDFQHLAIAFSRAMNIPARYVTGHLGDIRIPFSGPGDFSAWYEVYLEGRWWTMDARHNVPRIGRLLMAVGRDATDVAITTSFGVADLKNFHVESNEVDASGNPIPLPVMQPPAPGNLLASDSA